MPPVAVAVESNSQAASERHWSMLRREQITCRIPKRTVDTEEPLSGPLPSRKRHTCLPVSSDPSWWTVQVARFALSPGDLSQIVQRLSRAGTERVPRWVNSSSCSQLRAHHSIRITNGDIPHGHWPSSLSARPSFSGTSSAKQGKFQASQDEWVPPNPWAPLWAPVTILNDNLFQKTLLTNLGSTLLGRKGNQFVQFHLFDLPSFPTERTWV